VKSLAGLIALHPVSTFLVCGVAAVLLTLSIWTSLRRLRMPLWNRIRAAWRGAAVRWPSLANVLAPRAWQGGLLMLDLLIGFFVVLAAVALFLAIADRIGLDQGLGRFDVELAAQLARSVSHATLAFFAVVTHMADMKVQWALGAVVALALFARRQRLLAFAWVAAVAGNGTLNRLLKALFARSRPLHDDGLTVAHGWSFPSGHTSGAVAIYGMLAYLGIRFTRPVWHLPIALSALVLVLLVGYSRIVLQVHYPSDVLAALLSGGSWLMVCIMAARVIRVHHEYRSATAS
jgi:undecaprenyl-diphosphatase